SSRRRHTRFKCDWSSDVCSSDLVSPPVVPTNAALGPTCPCSPSPRKLDTPKRAEEKPAKKRAEDPPNKRAGRAPRYRDPGDDVEIGRASCRERGSIAAGAVVIPK